MHQNIIKHSLKSFNLHKRLVVVIAAAVGTAVAAIGAVLAATIGTAVTAIGAAIVAEINTPAFECRVGIQRRCITIRFSNRTNIGVVSKWVIAKVNGGFRQNLEHSHTYVTGDLCKVAQAHTLMIYY